MPIPRKVCASCSDPKKLSMRAIGAILGRGIKWSDYKLRTEAGQLSYYNDAQALLRNEVLINEINHYTSDMILNITAIIDDKEKQEMLRYAIDGVQALMERLEEIESPMAKKKEDFDPHEVI